MVLFIFALTNIGFFLAGLLVGIKHAKRGQAIKDALKK